MNFFSVCVFTFCHLEEIRLHFLKVIFDNQYTGLISIQLLIYF